MLVSQGQERNAPGQLHPGVKGLGSHSSWVGSTEPHKILLDDLQSVVGLRVRARLGSELEHIHITE